MVEELGTCMRSAMRQFKGCPVVARIGPLSDHQVANVRGAVCFSRMACDLLSADGYTVKWHHSNRIEREVPWEVHAIPQQQLVVHAMKRVKYIHPAATEGHATAAAATGGRVTERVVFKHTFKGPLGEADRVQRQCLWVEERRTRPNVVTDLRALDLGEAIQSHVVHVEWYVCFTTEVAASEHLYDVLTTINTVSDYLNSFTCCRRYIHIVS